LLRPFFIPMRAVIAAIVNALFGPLPLSEIVSA
jgi:hypothetical protein